LSFYLICKKKKRERKKDKKGREKESIGKKCE